MLKNIIVSALFLCGASSSLGKTLKLSEYKSEVSFLAIGKPGFLKIKGTGGILGGSITISHSEGPSEGQTTVDGTVTVALEKLSTGMDLRDKHMKEKYLEVSKYPAATIVFSKKLASPLLLSSKAFTKEIELDGVITIHGVTKKITPNIVLTKKESALHYESEFELDISDFQIDIPSFLGVTVAKTVKIYVEGTLPLAQKGPTNG